MNFNGENEDMQMVYNGTFVRYTAIKLFTLMPRLYGVLCVNIYIGTHHVSMILLNQSLFNIISLFCNLCNRLLLHVC
jgi:hypothetical protein